MNLRTLKRRTLRRQRAWIAHPLRWQVWSGRYRDISTPDRRRRADRPAPFVMFIHSEGIDDVPQSFNVGYANGIVGAFKGKTLFFSKLPDLGAWDLVNSPSPPASP